MPSPLNNCQQKIKPGVLAELFGARLSEQSGELPDSPAHLFTLLRTGDLLVEVCELLVGDGDGPSRRLLGEALQSALQPATERRAVKHHDLPQHLGHVWQGVRRQAEAAGVHELGDQLLSMLLHGLTNQLLPHLKVILVIIADPRVDEVSDKLHDAAVGVPVVQGCRGDGTLDDVNDDATAEECNGTALDEPRGEPEEVVHGVGVIPQAVGLLQQLEGGHAQSL